MGRRLPAGIAGVYLALGIAVWISFIRTNPDGLANIGLIFYVAPVSAVGVLLGYVFNGGEFPLIPDRFGYAGDHAIFYFPSLIMVAMLIAWLTRLILRRLGRKATPPSLPDTRK